MSDMPAAIQNSLLENYALLQYRVKAMQRKIEEFENGTRYLKLQEDQSRVVAGYIKDIKRLKQEVETAHKETRNVLDTWSGQCNTDWNAYEKELEKKEEEIRKLEDKYWHQVWESEETISKLTKSYEEKLAEKDAVIDALKSELKHKEALLSRDSTNTNLPTGQTPPGKEKTIPNSRRSTGKSKGGQFGHEKHALDAPKEEELTGKEEYVLDPEAEVCPGCGSDNFVCIGEEDRYEFDVEVSVKKTLHKIYLYECQDCGTTVCSADAPKFRAECQYGPNTQALVLSLMNTANVPMNKVSTLFRGMTLGQLTPSEAFCANLQRRAAKMLEGFRRDLRIILILQNLLYWDDTVVNANKKRICLRFYGNEKIAYYVAHEKKDLIGIREDNILEVLSATTRVMHDHNTVNYNALFAFINLECNAHLQRDLQKSADDTGHVVLIEIKELISGMIKERNDLVTAGQNAFSDEAVKAFNDKLTELLEKAEAIAKDNSSKYSGPDERALVARIIKYRANYFAWVKDFSLPTTNNLAERALRGVKSKMKNAGQFSSVEYADCYALIRTYIETCRRNGINEVEALTRLCEGNPYTVAEIFGTV